MDKTDFDSYSAMGRWNTTLCGREALNLCKTHRLKLCTVCSIVFHYDWDLKIANWKEFGDTAVEILNDVVNKLSYDGMKLQLDRYCIEYNDEVKIIAEKVEGLHKRNRGKNIDIFNEDDYVKDCIKVVKNVLESQAYNINININSFFLKLIKFD